MDRKKQIILLVSFGYYDLYDEVVDKLPNNSNVIELGSWMGKSTNYFATKLKEANKNVRFTSIDTFKGSVGYDNLLHRTMLKPFDNDLYTEFSNNSIILSNDDESEPVSLIKCLNLDNFGIRGVINFDLRGSFFDF